MSSSTEFDQELIQEFILDAIELIENADQVLIKLDIGQVSYTEGYRSIYNALHTLKGSLGMFGYRQEMNYIHKLEEEYKTFQNKERFDSDFAIRLSKSLTSLESRLKNPQSILYEEVAEVAKEVKRDSNLETPTSHDESPYYKVSKIISHSYLLVIDDNTMVLDSFVEYFGKRFSVCSVTNVNDGIRALQKNPDIHIIFCDFHMPSDKGTKFLDYLNQNQIDIPVIMMSDGAERKDLIELLKRHAFYYVEKEEGMVEFERALKKAQRERMKQLSNDAKKLILDNKST